MNKIMKAVNDLRGDLNNSYIFDGPKNDGYLTFNHDCQKYCVYSFSTYCANDADSVCKVKQFNDLVSQLETNFGTSCTYDDYIAEFWSDAPEYYDFYLKAKKPECDGESGFCNFTDGRFCFESGDFAIDGYFYVFKKPEQLKQAKPVYTQAMKDNGELPPIGSYFIDIEYNMKKQVLAIAHDLPMKRVVYKSDNDDPEYFGAISSECKPIDTRTDKEKAIDDVIKIFGSYSESSKKMLAIAFDEWVGE